MAASNINLIESILFKALGDDARLNYHLIPFENFILIRESKSKRPSEKIRAKLDAIASNLAERGYFELEPAPKSLFAEKRNDIAQVTLISSTKCGELAKLPLEDTIWRELEQPLYEPLAEFKQARKNLKKLLSNIGLLHYKIIYDKDKSAFLLVDNLELDRPLGKDQRFNIWRRRFNSVDINVFKLEALLRLDVEQVSLLINEPENGRLEEDTENLRNSLINKIELDVCLDSAAFELFASYIRKGADPTVITQKKGWNVLHAAAYAKNLDFIEWLKNNVTSKEWNFLLRTQTSSCKSTPCVIATQKHTGSDIIKLLEPNEDGLAEEKLEQLLFNMKLYYYYKITFDKKNNCFILTDISSNLGKGSGEWRNYISFTKYIAPFNRGGYKPMYYNTNKGICQSILKIEELLSLDVEKISSLLTEQFPSKEKKDELGALYTAALKNKLEKRIDSTGAREDTIFDLFKCYTREGADPTVTTTQRGWNVLHAAVASKKIDFIKWLKENVTLEQWQALMTAKTKASQKTAFAIAEERKGYTEIIELLSIPHAAALNITCAVVPQASSNRFSQFSVSSSSSSSAQEAFSTLREEISGNKREAVQRPVSPKT